MCWPSARCWNAGGGAAGRCRGRIAIASFDDLDPLRHVNPPVTSIRLPRYEIGKRSAQCLLDRIQGRTEDGVSVDLKFEIIQREST